MGQGLGLRFVGVQGPVGLVLGSAGLVLLHVVVLVPVGLVLFPAVVLVREVEVQRNVEALAPEHLIGALQVEELVAGALFVGVLVAGGQ